MAYRDTENRVSCLHVDSRLLYNGTGGVPDAPDALLFTGLYHLFPGQKNAEVRDQGVDHPDPLGVRIPNLCLGPMKLKGGGFVGSWTAQRHDCLLRIRLGA